VLVTTIGALSSKSVTAGQVIDTARIVCGRVYVTVRTGVRPSVPAIVEWGVKLYSNQPTNAAAGLLLSARKIIDRSPPGS